MPRPARVLAVVAAGVAVAGVSTACGTRPTPSVTVLSGSTTVVVKPQAYCFDATHCRITTTGNVGSIKASPGATLLVDVPRNVANSHWSASSGQLSDSGQFQLISGDGVSSPTLHDTHSTRLNVPYGSGDYYVVVQVLSGTKSTGSWVTHVTIKNR